MKAWLSHAGVPFVLKNVDDDLEAYHELVARGYRTVPVTVRGADAVVGFDAAALAALTGRPAGG
ncbi:MAG: glutaredoxin family protein [Vicinamibacterales bacterium]